MGFERLCTRICTPRGVSEKEADELEGEPGDKKHDAELRDPVRAFDALFLFRVVLLEEKVTLAGARSLWVSRHAEAEHQARARDVEREPEPNEPRAEHRGAKLYPPELTSVDLRRRNPSFQAGF